MKTFSLILFFIGGFAVAQQEQSPQDSVNVINRSLILKLGINLVDSTEKKSSFNIFNNFEQMAHDEQSH
ncbi:MAG: hypothetical protein P8P55_00080 [Flavobacteriaceae bacterium]|nr:hypothetical protein [Flavobacteriaceae bacterium]